MKLFNSIPIIALLLLLAQTLPYGYRREVRLT